jgi:hypothetical protein
MDEAAVNFAGGTEQLTSTVEETSVVFSRISWGSRDEVTTEGKTCPDPPSCRESSWPVGPAIRLVAALG